MITAKLFVDGKLRDVHSLDGSFCPQSTLAKACIHFGVTNENATILNVNDYEVIAQRNNLPVNVMLERGMPFTDLIAQSHLWRDLYELHQKRNSLGTV